MKTLAFPKYKTFIYGLCVDAGVSELVSQAEDDGCMFMQLIPVTLQGPPALIHGGRSEPILAYKMLVRLPESEYAALVARVTERQKAIQVAPNGSVPGVH